MSIVKTGLKYDFKTMLFFFLLLTSTALFNSCTGLTGSSIKFEITFPESVRGEPVTGRVFIMISRTDEREPRLQIGRYGVPFYGEDVENMMPGEAAVIDENTLGSPVISLKDIPAGEYFVQAMVNIYTKFERSDGHTVWMHMDQWEGQDFRRSPGNFYSDVQKITFDPEAGGTFRLETNNVIPSVEIPEDTKWVKSFKIQSDILTEFWGHPIYIGATILLPKGYEEHPNVSYPAVYHQGHFSIRPPMRFRDDPENDLYKEWNSGNFPRFIAVTIQHPTPYFDDSYAVNSANNGPFGDAIHQELIPEIERRFRAISEPWARVLTGGSTGGWESFALQVLYPDFYGGTWSFAPDPLDFHNVEGINIYEDANAFYKIHEWRKVPIANTRYPATGEVRLTSQQRNYYELAKGTKGRSGEQLDIWSAVFGPVGEDGYFKPLFDKFTGEVDPEVAQFWKENFDLRYYLETNWKEVGPKLVGKLNIICGHMDNYYLNIGVYHMEEFLESTTDPYYGGSVTYGAGPEAGHGYRPYDNATLLRIMADHITKNAPRGANTRSWKY
ncbi:alpha/beta hydrolase-fold protein [candidate division KSB1 bacterium]